MLRFFGWSSSNKASKRDNLDDELNSNLPPTRGHSIRSYKTPPSQISISAPIPRNCAASLTGLDNPNFAGSAPSGNTHDLRQFRHPNSSLSRLGAALNHPAASSSTSVGRISHNAKDSQHHYIPYHLPSPPLSDGGSDLASSSSINDGPPPAVIRIETNTRLPARKSLLPPPTRGASPIATQQPFDATTSAPVPMRRTASSPPSSSSPYHHSPADELSSSSSELTPTFPGGAAAGANAGGKWNLKLHTANHIYSQSTQSLPTSSSPLGASQFRNSGMHSDPSLACSEGNADAFAHAYSYPLVKQLSPIAEQEYMSPDSMKRPRSLPPSTPQSRVGSEQDMRGSAVSQRGSLTYSGSPIGSHTSEVTRPSPIYASPFISRPLNRTASQGSSRTHVSATSSAAGPRSTKSDSHSNAPVIPPLDLRPSFIGPHAGGMQPSPTGSGRIRTSKFSNPMPSIIGSTEGYEEDEYAGTTDRESLHAESFVTATSDDDHAHPSHRRGNSAKDIETVDKDSTPQTGRAGPCPESASVRSGVSRVMPPSASESFITRRWDRDAALGPGVKTFRAKKQWINVTPAFWAFWFGFLCPFLWLVGGWHFTHFGEQPPRLTVWEFYFTGFWKSCCGNRRKKEEIEHMKREGKKTTMEPPPLPRWVSEKQSSELGRARLNDPKRSLRGISFGYPFVPRPMQSQHKPDDEKTVGERLFEIIGKPNRIFDHLYGIKLREVRGRPESVRRMFDPWIQRCRYALCYAMLFLAIGLLTASAYLIVYNTRQL